MLTSGVCFNISNFIMTLRFEISWPSIENCDNSSESRGRKLSSWNVENHQSELRGLICSQVVYVSIFQILLWHCISWFRELPLKTAITHKNREGGE